MTPETTGLILNFSGALILAIGTSVQTEISMKHLKLKMNYPGGPHGMQPNAVRKNLRDLRNMRIAKWIIYSGYLLFVVGFALQLFAV